MNQHSSTAKKYYSPLIGAALVAASLFHFSFPVFAAGTEAGTILRNTATGSYEDDTGNDYTIESNTVDVTVAKIAGITNQPSGFTDETTTNNSVLTGDTVSFEFTITNVGNDISNIFIPDAADLATKGLAPGSLEVEVSPVNPIATFDFDDGNDYSRPANGIVPDVPINGQIIVKVTGDVTATAAGAPIEVLLGDTGTNSDPNAPVADTQNQPDDGINSDAAQADNEVRTETADNPGFAGAPVDGQKEASALQQTFLGSNPLAMTRIEKTRAIDDALPANSDADLDNNLITYNLELEVLSTTPNGLYTPGQLEGRDFGGRVVGVADTSNLVLISDAIPEGTAIQSAPLTVTENGRTWTPVYAVDPEPAFVEDSSLAADQITWDTNPPADLSTVTRVGWVYDANSVATGAIDPGTTIPGFTFDVITNGLNRTSGGTVANIAQVFGGTVNGENIFDESGDQDPSNFNGPNPGPKETVAISTGIANPSSHGVDSENNNNLNGADPLSPGGEDNVITIGAPGTLINGPDGQPTATGNVFGVGPDNNHDFQNMGVDNFPTDAKHNAGTVFDPSNVLFNNTLSNPGTTDLSNVLLQPINPEYDPSYNGDVTDENLPIGTTVTITLGGQTATYTYQDNAATTADNTDRVFVLTSGTPIIIPTLAAGVPLNYSVDVDLPANTGLSTDDAINGGFPVPVIAFVDGNGDGTPEPTENANLTVNQVYTGYVRVSKQVKVVQSDGTGRPGMGFANDNADKRPLPGDTLEYRVIYRNISEPQVGTGNNGILNGIDVMIDENGTVDAVDGGGLDESGNNWALDNNSDGDMDTTNVQNTAEDSNNGTITFFTGEGVTTGLDSLTSAGTVDPGDTVTGYRSTIPLLPPTGAEDPGNLTTYDPADGDSDFTFIRKVDEFDGLPQEGLD
ncbi:MAG: hypothetical protein WBM44_17795 [Waterburya sp.]